MSGHGGHSHGGGSDGHSHGGKDLEAPLLKNHGGHDDHGEGGGCCGGHGDAHDDSHGGHGGHGDEGHGGHGGHDHGGHGGHGGDACGGHGGHGGEHASEVEDIRKMRVAIYFALFFMSVEIVGGIVANSLAIITDAAHMLSDAGGFIVSLFSLQLAIREATKEYSFGYKQAEILGALLSIMIVWALTAVLLWEAVFRFFTPVEVDGQTMFIISVIGFCVNLILMKVLGHGHSHDGDDHGHSHGGGGNDKSAAMQAALAHVIGDIVQSLGVCLAAGLIWIKPFDVGLAWNGVSKWNYADPCCTLLFGVLVLFTTKSTLIRTINSLMVKSPSHINQDDFQRQLSALPDVKSVHDLHVWTMGSSDVLCTAHLLVHGREGVTPALKGAIKIAQKVGIGHSTFQIEINGEFDPALESYGSLHKNPVSSEVAPKGGCGDSHGGGGGGQGHGHDDDSTGHSGHAAHGHSHA